MPNEIYTYFLALRIRYVDYKGFGLMLSFILISNIWWLMLFRVVILKIVDVSYRCPVFNVLSHLIWNFVCKPELIYPCFFSLGKGSFFSPGLPHEPQDFLHAHCTAGKWHCLPFAKLSQLNFWLSTSSWS